MDVKYQEEILNICGGLNVLEWLLVCVCVCVWYYAVYCAAFLVRVPYGGMLFDEYIVN